MSEKAVGTDWKKRNILTLRHAAGANKYLNLNDNLKYININKLMTETLESKKINLFHTDSSLKNWNNLSSSSKTLFINLSKFCISTKSGNLKFANIVNRLINKPKNNSKNVTSSSSVNKKKTNVKINNKGRIRKCLFPLDRKTTDEKWGKKWYRELAPPHKWISQSELDETVWDHIDYNRENYIK